MSKSDDDDENSDDEQHELFYESLDRIVSSSNSSTSASDIDDESNFASCSPNRRERVNGGKIPRFPISDASFSSSSVEQRRDRLLRALGLSADPAFSRPSSRGAVNPSISENSGDSRCDFNRSVSFVLPYSSQKLKSERNSGCLGMNPLKSKGCTECKSAQCNSSSSCSCYSVPSSSILSIRSVSDSVHSDNNSNKFSGDNNNNGSGSGSGNVGVLDDLGSGVRVEPCSGSNKPSTVENGQCLDEIRSSLSPNSRSNVNVDGDGEGMNVDEVGGSDQMCTIKDLDNGKEFVVNEVREDGMWNMLREVATGRQLTMEEFEMCVGQSPIVQELMRRQNVERNRESADSNANGGEENGSKLKKKVSWLKSIKSVASSVKGYKERRSIDERDTSSEKGGRRSSSATDDSQDSFHGPERIRVRQYGKSVKELTALYKSQEIQAHNGSIWTIKFSLEGRYLASAGEDCVIHVWQVVETERKGELLMDRQDDENLNLLFLMNGSPEPGSLSPTAENTLERKRRGRTSISRKSMSLDHIVVPDTVFGLSERPICSFQGHLNDVLDLSWSKSQLLLSSSMDKTVRLWNLSSKSCLKIFSHSDYVTCIQFNPVDDRYFISGSLDAKVRIWSIPDRQVVDWNDLHEMVTAACYTPDGQGALVGSYKGSCRLYSTSENKLQQKCEINLQNKKKKSHLKKITGFQFAPGSSSEVLITSADSRIRVIDGTDLVHKFKGFRNTNSQISAALTASGKYVVCASEGSHVYVWKHEGDSHPNRSKGVTVTRSYEHFHCQDVSVAIPWPGLGDSWGFSDPSTADQTGPLHHLDDDDSTANHPPTPVEEPTGAEGSSFKGIISSATNGYLFDRIAATWPEEKLVAATRNRSPRVSLDLSNGVLQNRSAWGLVIVTAGLHGEIRTFQNFGLPVRI